MPIRLLREKLRNNNPRKYVSDQLIIIWKKLCVPDHSVSDLAALIYERLLSGASAVMGQFRRDIP